MEVFRVAGGPERAGDSITDLGDGLELLFDLPITIGGDHAEGLALFPRFEGEPGLLIVYDDPKPERRRGGSAVYADLYRLS